MNVVEFFAEKGYLLKPEFLEKLPEDFDKEELLVYLEGKDVIVVDDELLKSFLEEGIAASSPQQEKDLVKEEVKEEIKEKKILEKEDVVVTSFEEKSKKVEVRDFVNYFKSRYNSLKDILQTRMELKEAVSINRVGGKNNEKVCLIGIVNEKRVTKNENIILELEDLSGKISVLINKNRFEMFNLSKEVVKDEVIGIVGNVSNNFVFVDELFFPDVPVTKELKKLNKEEYAVFISDLHIGNKTFLKEDFRRFLDWLKGENGNGEQKNIVNKIKYLFIVGDLIEGVGIFPGQEKELEIKDYFEQYKEFNKLIREVPKGIKVILSPGNHDAMRLDEPQPILGKKLLGDLLEEENMISVSNPAWVNIAKTEDFPGFDVLIYHGMSFPYYADNVEGIRLAGGQQRADLIMKFLLKKRHLAPTHTSTSYFAGNEDYHVINKIPDFFVSGHIHRSSVANYRNVTLLNCSCWVPQSDYMEKMGLTPEPSQAMIVNLQTRDVKVLNFGESTLEKGEEGKEDLTHQILSAPQKILEKISGKDESK
jgi:DNA polymerase II small subunit|tara:strand:- start:29211 stop:30818 length:1608 start_codon:yes stop_codon:yes gene_type:complete